MIETEKPAALTPVCPHCLTDPLTVTVQQLPFPNGVQVLVASCATATCRKVLGVSFMGMAQPTIMPGRLIKSIS